MPKKRKPADRARARPRRHAARKTGSPTRSLGGRRAGGSAQGRQARGQRARQPSAAALGSGPQPAEGMDLLPEVYQRALVESVAALEVVTQIMNRNLDHDEIRRLLGGLNVTEADLFIDKLAELLRQTSGLLLVARRASDSLSLDILLPRMVELISEFLGAERCTIFLHDAQTGELFTKAGVGLDSEIRVQSHSGIAGAVFQSEEAIIVSDAYADARFNSEIDQQTGFHTRNLICVPLRHTSEAGTRVVGVVQVLNKRDGDFGPKDLALLDSLNSQAASAFVNAILHEEIKKARQQELELLDVTTALSSELKLEPLLLRIMDTVAGLLGAERATLFLHDKKTDELWALVNRGGERPSEIRFPAHQGLAGHVFGSRETVNIADAYADPRFNPEIDRRTGYRTRSLLAMPVINRSGEVIGVTQVLNKKAGPFSAIDEKRLAAFSAQASVAMENAQLFEEVSRTRNFNESILECITDGILTVDGAGRVSKANTVALRLLGWLDAPQSLLEQPVASVFAGDNSWIAETVSEVQRSGEPSVVMDADLALSAARGGEAQAVASMNLAVLPFKDPGQEEQGCLMMLEDVTREKRMRAALSRYMSKQLAERLLEQGEPALAGRLQKATVLFSDLRSFTSVSEAIGPQGTVQLLNEYFGLMADIVLDRQGLLDKYIGDAIMAVFGVPVAGPRDAELAVEAAVEMFRALRPFNAGRTAEGLAPIGMVVGLNTDEIVSGNIGSPKRMDYTVIGDGVNVASRLEKANRVYGTQLLLSELTRRELHDRHLLRGVDLIRLRGKREPLAVFEVLDHLEEDSPAREPRFLERYEDALGLYRRREWSRAEAAFAAALELHGSDALSGLYRRRCAYLGAQPPSDDWDGVWDMAETSKGS